MIRRLRLLIGALALSCGTAWADEPAGQDVVYFSADGPVRVRFTATIDGRPAEAVWREALDKLFALCDRDGDGQLDSKERAVFNQPRTAYRLVDQDGNVYSGGSTSVQFTNKSGKLDRAAFRAAFRTSGLAPVQAVMKPPRSKTTQMTEALFKHLDTDKNGKLSADELKAARTRLIALDVNEDELVSSQELLGRGYDDSINYFTSQPVPKSPAASPVDFVFPSGDAAATAKELIKQRDKNKDGTLTRDELGCDARGFAALDRDEDGRVSERELAVWLRSPPDLEFHLEFGNAPAKQTWTAMISDAIASLARQPGEPPAGLMLAARSASRLAAKTRPEPSGVLALALTESRLRFSANRSSRQSLAANWNSNMQQMRQQFDLAAGDKKSLDRKQFNENPYLNGIMGVFDLGDRNGDKKLDRKELDAAFAVLTALVACRAEVSIIDQGRGLFELLDHDDDNRLSPRELASADALLATLDRDGDGQLSQSEIPKFYPITGAAASTQVVQRNGFFADFGFVSSNTRVPRTRNMPNWFVKMDRNGDGDISRREFLGPAKLFRKLDADGDGLISPQEASAAKQ
jgi:Ca2+-binding EF-hand superfamily protein